MTKSASTFLYQLIEEILSNAGHTVCRIRDPRRGRRANYYDRITPELLSEIERRSAGDAVVLKTHGRPDPGVAKRIAEGRVKTGVSFRDPREIAMSMADNGARARATGNIPFSEIISPLDALEAIDRQFDLLDEWLAVPKVEAFSYNEICFATPQALSRICTQTGVAYDMRALAPFRNRMLVGELNVAKPLRYRELTEDIQAVFLQRFASRYSKLDFQENLAKHMGFSGEPRSRSLMVWHIENVLRLVRRVAKTRNLGILGEN